ncbi:putative orfan [Tupanvirus soda lake]|uniref:Orfan n=2 Tax=Tupanvirus TaxID=2094720 RepID=A0AC62AE00_9VIRU|nr:putative orfan [Tupanvirus soda lake]QKU35958.1 putative orfan [Tupanvirus soda lake]
MSTINFSNMMASDFKSLDLNDKDLLARLGLEPIPEKKTSFVNDDEKHAEFNKFKIYYLKLLTMASVLELQRENVFKYLADLSPSNFCDKDEDDSSDEEYTPKKATPKKATPKKAAPNKVAPTKTTPYQKFILEEIIRQKKLNPNLKNTEYMSLAAKVWWNKQKKNNNSGVDKSTSKTFANSSPKSESESEDTDDSDSSDESSEDTDESSEDTDESSEDTDESSESNSDSESESSDDEKPAVKSQSTNNKSAYQQFILVELKKQREQAPGLSNKEYMMRAAKAWFDKKKSTLSDPNKI